MWYVNQNRERVFVVSILSFILTMWYVNKSRFNEVNEARKGFILTMWYVNFNSSSFNLSSCSKFYINYVVCKLSSNLAT